MEMLHLEYIRGEFGPMSQALSLDVCIMKLLLLCLLFGAVVALTTAAPAEPEPNNGDDLNVEDPDMQGMEKPESVDEPEMSEAENVDSAERAKRSVCCRPGSWCTYGGRRYILISSARNWAQANVTPLMHLMRHCQGLGGTLAVVRSSTFNTFLRNTAANRRSIWIGFSDAQYNNYWFWANGERTRYTKWCRGQPNNGSGKDRENCAYLNYSSNCWYDVPCTYRLPYICERK
ncbi:hypothetical protein WMY93_014186 [Mugilogobius chulae]|uniref:C-type lectin domain-containing protein n=1 Tax=Mugilogobius chulae TaxID=88201 RepID=A0AAW0P0U3_9GOBI